MGLLVFCLLLTALAVPFLADYIPPVGLAGGVEKVEEASQCAAFGNNWTACGNATASDDIYAEANQAGDGNGTLTPITAFQDLQQSTSSTSLQPANAETSALAAGEDYLLIYSGNHGGSDTSAVSELVLEFGTTVIARGVGEGRGFNNHWGGGQTTGFYMVTGDGTSTLRFRFRCVTGGDTCYAGAMAIVAVPLGNLTEGVDYWLEVRNGDAWNVTDAPTGSWVGLLTGTFSLPDAGDYLVLMSAEGRTNGGSGTSEAARVRFRADGANLGSAYHQEWEDNRDSYNFAKAQLVTLGSGSRTFEVDARSRANPGADFRRGRIVVLSASSFDQIVQSTDTSGAQTTSTSFVDFAGLDAPYTPNQPEPVVVLANAVLGFSAANTATAELRDDTAGVSYRTDSGEYENDNGFDASRDQQPTLMVHAEQISATTTWKVRYRATASGTAAIGRNEDNTAGIRSDLIVWSLSLRGPGKNDTAWFDFGLDLGPQDTVNRVEVGVEWYRLNARAILNVTVSWDGGSTWATNQTASNKSVDDDTVEFLDFTSATAWDPTRVSDANLRVRVGTNESGARLDYLTVRVNYNAAPRVSDFRLEDGAGTSRAGDQLEVGTPYHFLFNVSDEDGWSDIGTDGSVSLRLWYDGNVTPELPYGAQTNGSSFRIELRYEDALDPGNASVDEWSVVEGDASYSAVASSGSAILNGSLVVGFAFDLAFTLGSQIGGSNDPTNTTPGAYNDPGSWNAEIVTTDGVAVVTHPTAATGEHMEFGVFPPVLDLTLVSSSTTVDPGDILTLNASVENLGPGNVQNVLLEASIDTNASYLASTPSGTYDTGARVLWWTVPLLTPGQQRTFEWTVRVALGTPDLASVQTTLRVSHEDGGGRSRPPQVVNTESTIQIPAISPVLRLDRLEAERGDVVLAILYFNNTGSGRALRAWVNWSLDGHYELMDIFPAQTTTFSAEGFDIWLTDVDPGAHSLVARLRVIRGLEDGLAMQVRINWEVTDGNGNPLLGAGDAGVVTLLAPILAVDLRASDTSVRVGSEFVLEITVENTGRADGSGWLNMTLPPGAAFVSQNGTLEVTTSAGLVSWRIASLAPTDQIHIQVRLRVNEGPSLESFVLAVAFTDGEGSPPLTVFSNQVFVRFLGSGAIPLPSWIFLLLLLIPAVFAAYYVNRRLRHPELRIEEVFVIHRKGILVAHQSRTLTPDTDRDILAAMFEAVQGFVQEAFARGTEGSMRGLRFENFNILIEQGTYHYVAVVYQGQESRLLERRVATLSQSIEAEFGTLLAAWVGDMNETRGIRHLLPLIWGESAPFASREAPQPTAHASSPLAPTPQVEYRSIPGKLVWWLPIPVRTARRLLRATSMLMRDLIESKARVLRRITAIARAAIRRAIGFVRGASRRRPVP